MAERGGKGKRNHRPQDKGRSTEWSEWSEGWSAEWSEDKDWSEDKGKGKGRSKKEADQSSRWVPAPDWKSQAATDWKPRTSEWKPVAAEAKPAAATGPEREPTSSSSRAPAAAQVSSASTLTTSAAAFVPGQGLSVTAAPWVPSATAAAWVPSATAAPWVPSTTSTTFVPGQEFVPGQSLPSTALPEFVPGQSSWSGAQATSLEASWDPNAYATDYNLAQNTMYGAASYAPEAQIGVFGGNTCRFNFDDFASDSDSSSSPSPRAGDTKVSQPGTAAPPSGTAPIEDQEPRTAEVPLVEKVEDRRPSADETPVLAAKTEDKKVDEAKPAPLPIESNGAKAEAEGPCVKASPASSSAPSAPSIVSPMPSPGKGSSSDFYSPASRASNGTPLMSPMRSEASGLQRRAAPGHFHLSEDLMSGEDLSMDELGGEFSLPAAADLPDECVEATLVAEMSERTLKHWIRRFANDRDTVFFARQYHLWTDNGAGEAKQEVVAWLLQHGLDDCRSATPVTTAVELLLRKEGLPAQTLEQALAAYSEEDLEDLKLDNPKAIEFVDALREVVKNAPLPGTVEVEERRPVPEPSTSVATDVNNVIAAPRKSEDRTEAYLPEALMEVRRALKQTSAIENYSGPRWTTETAAKLFGNMPLWQQQRMAQGSASSSGAAQGTPDWRDAQKKNADSRSRRDNTGRKSSGGGGRDKEINRQKEAPIQVSETSWVAQIRRWKDDSKTVDEAGETMIDEQFLRELRLTLNKLTVEKFDDLSDHLILLVSKSSRPNRGIPVLMQLVFEKATTQHHFIDMYVNLCVKLHQWLMANNDIVRVESQTNFKRILLNQCQSSFETYLEPPDSLDGLSGDSLYEAQVKYKTKMLGNIKLVGQLIRRGMLSPNIALSIAAELVRDDLIVREERLETLTVFLETIGPSLDDPNWTHSQQFETIFAKVQRLASDKSVANRVRYLLRDVLDLRRGKWLGHKVRKFDEDAPTSLAEVKSRTEAGSRKGAGKGKPSSDSERRDSQQQTYRKKSGPTPSPQLSPQHKPDSLRRLLSSPGGKAASNTASPRPGGGGDPASPSQRQPLKLKPASVPPDSTKLRPVDSPDGGAAAKADAAVAGAGARASKPKAEILADFHKEVAQIIRQVGNGITVSQGVQRLQECSLPLECVQEEVVDLIARMVDEPRERRQHMFPLLKELFVAGVFSPPSSLRRSLTAFIEDAFVDPGSVDPPDLVDIVLRELTPALGLQIRALTLTPCVEEIFAEVDDGR